MGDLFGKMEYCALAGSMEDDQSLSELLQYMADPAWQVRYSAVIALGERRRREAIPCILGLLKDENMQPVYSQPPGIKSGDAGSNIPFPIHFPQGITEEIKEAWRRRGRIKQEACLALGKIGHAETGILEVLHRYAVDQREDYMVRAAACRALGQLGCRESVPILEQACEDGEWCTRTEAAKALAQIEIRI